jgi:hypothetical protein
MAVLGTAKELTRKRIDVYLLGHDKSRKINRWPRRHPEAVAWMLWRVVAFEQALGLALAINHLDLDEAAAVAEAVLANRTTGTAFDDLALWLVWTKPRARSGAGSVHLRGVDVPVAAPSEEVAATVLTRVRINCLLLHQPVASAE